MSPYSKWICLLILTGFVLVVVVARCYCCCCYINHLIHFYISNPTNEMPIDTILTEDSQL